MFSLLFLSSLSGIFSELSLIDMTATNFCESVLKNQAKIQGSGFVSGTYVDQMASLVWDCVRTGSVFECEASGQRSSCAVDASASTCGGYWAPSRGALVPGTASMQSDRFYTWRASSGAENSVWVKL